MVQSYRYHFAATGKTSVISMILLLRHLRKYVHVPVVLPNSMMEKLAASWSITLQLMKVPGMGDNRVGEISEISRSLKALAKEMNCPVIALSQAEPLTGKPSK